ncbi:hypothetical protein [Noviherbaspirillum galbum]|uniref:Uncharacterized protein n=1 Tax=Noviherbaspirillum galbum TaxID=2709383 RepID=A0A6B3SP01_9BURK|nr:hypothetical protein [Noviherbaspirillum galbum]NEX62463.1 hypothetical protein [Noviherbaspirillum galbum]
MMKVLLSETACVNTLTRYVGGDEYLGRHHNQWHFSQIGHRCQSTSLSLARWSVCHPPVLHWIVSAAVADQTERAPLPNKPPI